MGRSVASWPLTFYRRTLVSLFSRQNEIHPSSLPPDLFARLNEVAHQLVYTVRGQKWKLLEKLLIFADLDEHTRDVFRNR